MSASGSGSKQKLAQWPGKDTFNKSKNDPPKKDESDSYDPKAMEEYLKKQ